MRIQSLFPFVMTSALMAQQSADVIFINGKIWTVDAAKPEVEAVAVAGSRIIAVGSTKEVEAYRTKKTQVIDLEGRRMLPGFIDNHTHFMTGGFQLQNVDLRHAMTEEAFAAIIKKRADERPGKWIVGGDWDHENWKNAPLPTKELIDRNTQNTPVFVWRYDEHMALANSYVLKLAGITKESIDPPGGMIVRDPKTGEPTGILKDEAMSAVYRVMPDDAEEDRLAAARAALGEARRWGVTSVQDVSSGADVKTYQALRRSGDLTLRFHCRLPISQWEQLSASGIQVPFGDEWIRIGSLKAFADGSLGSSTALFFEPYTSDPSTKGLASDIVQDGRLEKWAIAADKAHLQLSIHAIGDSANSIILDLFEKIVAQNPKWDRRFRIEHAQHIAQKDFDRFAKLGVIASAQPYHAADDGRWAVKRIGEERCKRTYPFRTFLDKGVMLTFGSDWTVAPINPLVGIHAAVTRRTTDGANPNGWIPEQKISVKEAIACYTINNAYAVFEQQEKGSISVGKLADFVVLNEDIVTMDPTRIDKVTVGMTILGGRTIYSGIVPR
jgi:hypothetical protein